MRRVIPSSRIGRACGQVLAVALLIGSGGRSHAAPAQAPSPSSSRPNLLLITAEGLRPDRLGCYRGKSATATPNIDALASEGRLFEQVITSSVSSVPAVASLLTGRTPFQTQVWDDHYRNRLSPAALTLAERLKQEGYSTAAFVATSRLAAERGLDQGFDLYQDGYSPPADGVWKLAIRPGNKIGPAAASWLEGIGGSPFFLWIHLIETSVPPSPSQTQPAAIADAYAGYVRDLDARLGETFDLLKKRKLWDKTIVVLTADHGTSLGEHGELRSGIFLYDSTARVPLILKTRPEDKRERQRVRELAGLVDVFPTLEGILRLKPTPGLAGRDLLAASQSPGTYYSVALLGREVFGWSPLEMVARGGRRLILGNSSEMYDVASDPVQQKRLESGSAAAVRELQEERRRLAGGSPLPPPHFLPDQGLTPELARRIKEKGYAEPAMARARSRPLPDARRYLASLRILELASLGVDLKGDLALLAAKDRVLEADPEGLFPLVHVASLMIAAQKAEKAPPEELDQIGTLLKTAQKNYPLEQEVYHLLGHLAFQRKSPADAELFLKAAAELSPRYPSEVSYDLACAYALQGKKEAALSELRQAIRRGFRDSAHIAEDSDLTSLRQDASFKRLMQEEFPASSGR